MRYTGSMILAGFQSTRPARGATSRSLSAALDRCISIHAPREGRDHNIAETPTLTKNFNPRAPRGARRRIRFPFGRTSDISIHAPREGRDTVFLISTIPMSYFNPRAPRGARPQGAKGDTDTSAFQSTRPARGATVEPVVLEVRVNISIHAPREGRDKNAMQNAS